MYELLTGMPPFYASSREQLFDNILNETLSLPSYLTSEAKNLLKGVNIKFLKYFF